MIHSFNTEIAAIYGLEEAVILNNLTFWIEKNAANGVNFNDGRYWTYNSVNAFCELFPYLSKKQIYKVLKSLEDQGALLSGNYNEKAYDRTKWYALSDKYMAQARTISDFPKWENGNSQTGKCNYPNGKMEIPKQENGFSQTGTPIPDSKPDNKPNGKTTDKKKFSFKDEMLALGVDEDVLADWMAVRVAKKQKNTQTAFKYLVTKFNQSGMSPNECVKISASRSWGGFDIKWTQSDKGSSSNYKTSQQQAAEMAGFTRRLDSPSDLEW